nr:hypothetical protein [Tanacetum cinerariifolium]
DGSFRMCIDYRELNKIDLYSGCHQMRHQRFHGVNEPDVHDRVETSCHSVYRRHLGLHKVKRGARAAFEDEFGAAEEREVSCEAQQGRSGVTRKLFESFRNKMGNEPILALPEGSDNFVVMREARVRMRA